MGNKTKIEWVRNDDGTLGSTWNPISGCTKVSAGCKHCYAETIANRFWGERKFAEVRCHPERLDLPLHWRKPRRIFVNSMSDLFHEDVPDKFIDRVFVVMALCPQHTFQILTKRPQRMHHYLSTFDWECVESPEVLTVSEDRVETSYCTEPLPIPNIHLGVSVEDQATADERIPLLLQTPAAVRWLSCEPLLSPVNIGMYLSRTNMPGFNLLPEFRDPLPGLDWIICGAGSGPHARPMDLDWARSLRDQCKIAGVPFFMKQICKNGRKIPLHLWPADLLVREYPDVK